MFCPNCGERLSDNAQFCTACGVPTVQEETTEEQPAQKAAPNVRMEPEKTEGNQQNKIGKGKKIFLAILAGILVVIIGVVVLLACWYFSPEEKLLRALEVGDYDIALEIYNEELDGEESNALTDNLTKRINAVKENFINGTIDYEKAKLELYTLEDMGIGDVMPLLEEVEDFVNALNGSRIAFSTAETMIQEGNYEGAIGQYKQVLEIDENYATAIERLGTAVDNYRSEILAEAETYANNSLYEDAIVLLSLGLEVLPEDAALSEQMRIYEAAKAQQDKEDLLAKAAGFAKNGDLPSAIELLADHEDNAELKAAYRKYCQQYEDEVLAQVDALLAEKDFDGAIALLNKALTVLSDNENLTNKRNEVEAKKPVSITTLTPINGSWDWNEGNPVDPFGNDYSSACNFAIHEMLGDGTKSIEYRVYQNYSTLTGSIAPYKSIEEDGEACIKIYADDVLIYTSPTITRKTDAFEFSVNITNAEYIIIQFCGINSGYWTRNAALLSNVELWPE